jgi:hypothetical protein
MPYGFFRKESLRRAALRKEQAATDAYRKGKFNQEEAEAAALSYIAGRKARDLESSSASSTASDAASEASSSASTTSSTETPTSPKRKTSVRITTVARPLFDDERTALNEFEAHTNNCRKHRCDDPYNNFHAGRSLCSTGRYLARHLLEFIHIEDGRMMSQGKDRDLSKSVPVSLPKGFSKSRGMLNAVDQGMTLSNKATRERQSSTSSVESESSGGSSVTGSSDDETAQHNVKLNLKTYLGRFGNGEVRPVVSIIEPISKKSAEKKSVKIQSVKIQSEKATPAPKKASSDPKIYVVSRKGGKTTILEEAEQKAPAPGYYIPKVLDWELVSPPPRAVKKTASGSRPRK